MLLFRKKLNSFSKSYVFRKTNKSLTLEYMINNCRITLQDLQAITLKPV